MTSNPAMIAMTDPAEARRRVVFEPSLEPAPIDILIVDDEPKNLTVLETVLNDPAYRLVRASSAEQALLALIDREFALLILDIQMPVMNGFELAHMIKTRKRTAHVPIIFLTAYYNEEAHMIEGYDTGAVDYLHKPVNPVVLRSKVAVFAELYRKNRELSNEVETRLRIEEELRKLNETLDQRVRDRTRELEEHSSRLRCANDALEQFAFAASHDLQEPLRTVAIYSQLLKQRCAVNLPGEAASFLEVIVEGAERMRCLISSLLSYAQIDRLDEPVEITDSEEVLDQVVRNLARLVNESEATIEHGSMPRVPIKRFHLEQLLQNLIGNALKYRKQDEPSRVHVMANREDQHWHFVVSDNGAGIGPEYHSTIFGLFKRLHGSEQAGSGMGLPICQRIVERYGGRIWVESAAGTGAKFHFTLPVQRDTR